MKNWIFGLVLSAVALGGALPVDEEIAALKAKAQYLEDLKAIFQTNNCSISVNSNKVGLAAGALRSEGLVMAIGPHFAGNYLAYHKAPKPEQLERVIESTLLKAGAGRDASIIGSRLGYTEGSSAPTALQIFVADPYKVDGTEDLWLYEKTALNIKLPQNKVHVAVEAKTKKGATVRLECN